MSDFELPGRSLVIWKQKAWRRPRIPFRRLSLGRRARLVRKAAIAIVYRTATVTA